jgi:hypothetical protein
LREARAEHCRVTQNKKIKTKKNKKTKQKKKKRKKERKKRKNECEFVSFTPK